MCLLVALAGFLLGMSGTVLAGLLLVWLSTHAGKAGPRP